MNQTYRFYKWLDTNIDPTIFDSIYDYSYYGTLYSNNKENRFKRYYNLTAAKDIDLELNNEFLVNFIKIQEDFYENKDLDDSDQILKSIYLFNEDYFYRSVYIPPASNRAHCASLFKQIMDYSADNKISIPKLKYDEDGNLIKIKMSKIKLFDTGLKNNFYRMCYNFS
jgi:hypothetical protein